MSLSVVIPSKSIANLLPCLDAIRKTDSRLESIIVDDGFSDDERNAVQFKYPAVFMPGQKPFIFARNVNIGIHAAGSDVIVLNDDALLQTSGGFTLLQRSAQQHPEFGIIGATTNVTGQPLQQPRNIGLREVPHFAFVCVLIPRRTIDRVGLLDERYCLDYGCEDRDYCEAVTRAGLKVGVHDGCYVDHGSLTSTFRGSPRTPKSFAQNYELFKAKWGLRA